MRVLLWTALAAAAWAGSSAFSVSDDIFAYPQYEISIPTSYVLENQASEKLELDTYQRMLLQNQSYLCYIPPVQAGSNTTEEAPSEDERKSELVRAADRGWQLLQDMEGKQCLYYSTGWWSYSFCYNSAVRQFHALPPDAAGARTWPPQEDPTAHSYVLGKYNPKAEDKALELQTKADTSFLVQKLDGGTPCDLTGENRKVEVQFHCHPQSIDRIGYIKETATCAYLLVVYTPRLCNDVAFQPAKDLRANTITCYEILSESEVASLESADPVVEQEQQTMIGNIVLGGMKHVGQDGKKIERGRIVMTPEEKAEIVIMQKDGQISGLSPKELKKMNIDPEEMEMFQKQLEKIAKGKDWKIERLGNENGQIQLRGIVEEEDEDEQAGEAGSEEEYQKEL